MEKSAEAFRTISEVSDILDTPAHVLRFWESRFAQVKPVKRAGGRRYYRPSDLALLGGIRKLLHEDGMTIRGVQKILREQGVRHVAALSGAGADHPGAGGGPAPQRRDASRRGGAQVAAPDPDGLAGPVAEAPMEVDAPTLPLGQPGNIHAIRTDAPEPAATPDTGRPPAAAMLRAMDAIRAREHRGELRGVYRRLSALRDRLAASDPEARD